LNRGERFPLPPFGLLFPSGQQGLIGEAREREREGGEVFNREKKVEKVIT
jgi:hypothetical protein